MKLFIFFFGFHSVTGHIKTLKISQVLRSFDFDIYRLRFLQVKCYQSAIRHPPQYVLINRKLSW